MIYIQHIASHADDEKKVLGKYPFARKMRKTGKEYRNYNVYSISNW